MPLAGRWSKFLERDFFNVVGFHEGLSVSPFLFQLPLFHLPTLWPQSSMPCQIMTLVLIFDP